jgi:outer membrane protein
MADLNEKYKVELKQMQDEYTNKYSAYVAQQDSLTEILIEKNAGN